MVVGTEVEAEAVLGLETVFICVEVLCGAASALVPIPGEGAGSIVPNAATAADAGFTLPEERVPDVSVPVVSGPMVVSAPVDEGRDIGNVEPDTLATVALAEALEEEKCKCVLIQSSIWRSRSTCAPSGPKGGFRVPQTGHSSSSRRMGGGRL